MGDKREDDFKDIKAAQCIEITSEDSLYSRICKSYPFREWGGKAFARRTQSTNAQGQTVVGFLWNVYDSSSGDGEAEAKDNIEGLQKYLFENPSREPCYITIVASKYDRQPQQVSPRERDSPRGSGSTGGPLQGRTRHRSDKRLSHISGLLDTLCQYR